MKPFEWGKQIIAFSLIISLMGCSGANYTFDKKDSAIKQKIDSITGDKGSYGVSASHPVAVEEGMKVLRNGGNAIDAAIVVSYVLNVVEPYASGIGGGGGMLIVSKDKESFIDYRETAPHFADNKKILLEYPDLLLEWSIFMINMVHYRWMSYYNQLFIMRKKGLR